MQSSEEHQLNCYNVAYALWPKLKLVTHLISPAKTRFCNLVNFQWHKGAFTIGVPKERKKDSRTFLGLFSTNNINMKQI
jgi:hypothetical protein